MARISNVLLTASLTMASALVVERSHAAMRPDVAAKALEKMENTWASQAYVFLGCATTGADFNCKEAPKAFAASCVEVASPLFKVTTKENFFEYMNDVCTNMQLGWHQATCQKVGTFVDAQMSASGYENRDSAEQRAQKACGDFWSHSVAEQEAKAKKEKAKEEEDSKKEKAQEEKEEKEAKNAKPVSFLQETASEAEALRVWQQQELAEVQRHEAEVNAALPPASDDLTHAWNSALIEVKKDSGERVVYRTEKEEEERQRKRAKKHEEQKQMGVWLAAQTVIANHQMDLIKRVNAEEQTKRDSHRKAGNYELSTEDWY